MSKPTAGSFRLWWVLAGILLFLPAYFLNPLMLEEQASKVLAVAVLMLAWWLSDAVPMPVVALIPVTLFPLLGLMKINDAAASYGSPVVFLFMGGFMIGLAMEKWNLHRRIALNIVKLTGTSANKIILGFIISSAFLSMWLSNTATAMMMFPIAMSVITLVEQNKHTTGNVRNFSLVLMLSVAYAANIGGFATIIGTPPNVVMGGILRSQLGIEISFLRWMLFATPLAMLILTLMYLLMVKVLYPNKLGNDAASAELIVNELESLGPMSRAEKGVTFVFALTALLWITRAYLNQLFTYMGWVIQLDDTIIAMLATFLLFIIPVNKKENQFILEWNDTSRLAWGILLLFGGGLALADALNSAGLIALIGQKVAVIADGHIYLLLVLLTIIAIFLTELMSNVALVTVFVPVVIGIAQAMHIHPLYYAVPVTIGASCAFMLPMGTPPNAIVFASGKIKISEMAKAGFFLNLLAGILITLFSVFMMQLVYPDATP